MEVLTVLDKRFRARHEQKKGERVSGTSPDSFHCFDKGIRILSG
jgi:hypothetical protein